MTAASPWAALMPVERPAVTAASPSARNGNTGRLFDALAQGPRTTAELTAATGLCSKRVWGLLGSQRHLGRVTFVDGVWSLCTDHDEQVAEAVAFLRRRGWTVTKGR